MKSKFSKQMYETIFQGNSAKRYMQIVGEYNDTTSHLKNVMGSSDSFKPNSDYRFNGKMQSLPSLGEDIPKDNSFSPNKFMLPQRPAPSGDIDEFANFESFHGVKDPNDLLIMDENRYEYVTKKLDKVDADNTEKFNTMLQEIKTMCETIFVMPVVTPKVLEMVDNVKNTLPDYYDLSNNITSVTRNYYYQIMEDDQ